MPHSWSHSQNPLPRSHNPSLDNKQASKQREEQGQGSNSWNTQPSCLFPDPQSPTACLGPCLFASPTCSTCLFLPTFWQTFLPRFFPNLRLMPSNTAWHAKKAPRPPAISAHRTPDPRSVGLKGATSFPLLDAQRGPERISLAF